MNNTKKYFYNIEDITEKIAEQDGDVEIYPNGDYEHNTITIPIKTLTECSDPKVNYYDDGMDSIEHYIETLKERLQLKEEQIKFIEDYDIGGDEWETWINHHGYIQISLIKGGKKQ